MSKRVVTIGGGGGHSAVVSILKDFDIELTAICNTVDDGGSSGELRKSMGVYPPGDVRQVISKLAGTDELEFRFNDGEDAGMTRGNLLLAKYEKEFGSFQKAIDKVRQEYGIKANVMPMTEGTAPTLHAKTLSGKEIVGQRNTVLNIWDNPNDPYETIWVEPKNSKMPRQAIESISEADFVIIPMGDLYSSVAPVFTLSNFKSILEEVGAKIIWLPNPVAPIGHKHYEKISGVLRFLQKFSLGFIPDIIISHNGKFRKDVEAEIIKRGYMISKMDLEDDGNFEIIKEDLLSSQEVLHSKFGDQIERSPVKYDNNKLKNIFSKIL